MRYGAFSRGFAHLSGTVIGTLICSSLDWLSLSLRLILIMRFLGIITRNWWMRFFGAHILRARFEVSAAGPGWV